MLPRKKSRKLKGSDMTVCIAAACGFADPDGPYVVAAADRMITIGQLHFASQTIGLFAGDMQLHATAVPKAATKINDRIKDDGRITVEDIAQTYAEEFGYYRRSLAEREILFPMNMTFESFRKNQQMMAHYQVSEITDRLTSYSIDSEAIIAGIDHTGVHLYLIRDPGVAICYDTPFFVAIGAGESLASTQFMISRFDKTWSLIEALWLTFLAKARAEVAGGVGRQTDILIVGKAGRSYALNKSDMDTLYDAFDTLRNEEDEATKKAILKIDDYIKTLVDTAAEEISDTGQQTSAKKTDASKSSKSPNRNA